MFKLCLDNGLPAKPYKFVEHFDDYEETDEYKEANPKVKDIKIILLDFEKINNNLGVLKKIYYINKQIWIESDNSYIVCKDLSNKIISYIEKYKKINLGFLLRKENRVSVLDAKKIDFL